ncbi:MAG: iron chelate uptake ABC transporter family permease subunit [Alphaproteobacteria bacterium]
MSLLDDFVWRGLLAGLGVAMIAGPLGCVVVWRRMAYFGDSLAHSALLGVALGFLLSVSLNAGILAVCIAFALAMAALQRQRWLAADTLLGILAHTMLALGILVLSLTEGMRVDLMGYLFGDMLAVTHGDLVLVYGGGAVVLLALAAIWRPLVALTVHEELARAEGVPVQRVQLVVTLLLATLVAVAMKIVGVLLVVALLIIPAATARLFARTPEAMAASASAVGCLAVAFGMEGSLTWDTPSGPSVVVAAFLLFIGAHGVVPLMRAVRP